MNTDWDYPDNVELLRELDPALAREFADFTGITGVLNWMQRRGLAKARIDIIGQDEFHYDFMIELVPAGRWVAFGVT